MTIVTDLERYSHKRIKSLHDPAAGLFCTGRFPSGTLLYVPDSFRSSNRNITWAVTLAVGASAPNGSVFEIGGANGTNLWFDSVTGKFGYGAGTNTTTTGAKILIDYAPYLSKVIHVVAATNPGLCAIRLWINGRLVGMQAGTTPPMGGVNSIWAATPSSGKVNGVDGTYNTRVPSTAAVALTNVSIVGNLKVYSGQVPRHFRQAGRLH